MLSLLRNASRCSFRIVPLRRFAIRPSDASTREKLAVQLQSCQQLVGRIIRVHAIDDGDLRRLIQAHCERYARLSDWCTLDAWEKRDLLETLNRTKQTRDVEVRRKDQKVK